MKTTFLKSCFTFSLTFCLTIPIIFAHEISVDSSIHSLSSNQSNPAEKYEPSDIANHWAKEPLKDFIASDNLAGYTDQSGNILIQPDKTITRAEFVTLLVRILQLKSNGTGKAFSDVKSTDWFYEPIRIASDLNIIGGTTPTIFKPNQYITRGEIAAIIERGFNNTILFQGTLKDFPDVQGHWAEQSIQDISKVGIMSGYQDGNFQPNKNATRAEAVASLYRSLNSETKNIPTDDQFFVNQIKDGYFKMYDAINMQDYNQICVLSNTYATGEIKADMDEMCNVTGPKLISLGQSITMINQGQTTFKIISKNTHLIKVEADNEDFIIEYKDNNKGINQTMEQKLNETFSLKKMEDGTWKIYNVSEK